MDNDIITEITEEAPAEDELLRLYDKRRIDDAAAMQTALCVFIAAVFFAAHLLIPDIADPVFSRITALAQSEHEIIGNPISLIEGLL